MSFLLAIDTATDAFSLALKRGDELRVSHELIPRRHHQELIARVDELLAGDSLVDLKLDALVFGRGPGSFTGLRIAASFVQGLAFSLQLPVIGLSTLQVQLRTLMRQQALPDPCLMVSSIDARIGQLYVAFFLRRGEQLQTLGEADIVRGDELTLPLDDPTLPLIAVGSGAEAIPDARLPGVRRFPDVLPEAQDMLPMAERELALGNTLTAVEATPDYVQPASSWKTVAEQGQGG